MNAAVNPLLVILGPTATGKTALAVHAAHALNGEIISADSRQIYREMDLGTGKDLQEYNLQGENIPVHLLDIHPPGYKYNVYEYQTDFLQCYQDVISRNRLPVMCGGSGMYMEAILGGYRLVQVPVDEDRRKKWESLPDEILIDQLAALKPQHNTSDFSPRKRLIRALEIALYEKDHPGLLPPVPHFETVIIGVHFPREIIRERITRRLNQRMNDGMLEEVKQLLHSGVSPEDLAYYGLEYKYLTLYLQGILSYEIMMDRLNTAIHQFAKRQMTWFRKMEREGYLIHWIPGELEMDEKISRIGSLVRLKGLI